MKYRKKPVEIEAVQWVSDNIEQVYEMLGDNLIINTDEDKDEVKHFINTLEGKMEMSWGDTNIKFLVDNNCHIWDGDAYKNYCKIVGSIEEPDYSVHVDDPNQNCTRLMTMEEFINKIKTDTEFAKQWGDLGPVYGKQWRNWKGKLVDKSEEFDAHTAWVPEQIDQIANLINDLKTNPDSRRLMVTAWNPADLEASVLPPCHYGFQVYTRELSLSERTEYKKKKDGIARTFAPYTHQMLDNSNIPTRAISLMYNARSQDVPLGTPFNLASYGLLLEIIAKEVNMVPDELITNMGDCHIYLNQIDGVKEQLTREPYPLPTLVMVTNPELKFDEYVYDNFKLVNYQSHPTIKIPLSN